MAVQCYEIFVSRERMNISAVLEFVSREKLNDISMS